MAKKRGPSDALKFRKYRENWVDALFPLDRISNPRQPESLPEEWEAINPASTNSVISATRSPRRDGFVERVRREFAEGNFKFDGGDWFLVDVQGRELPAVVDATRFQRDRVPEKYLMRSLPSWMTLKNVWPGFETEDTYEEVDKVVRARQRLKREGKAGDLDECQSDAIAPSIAAQMEGYVRVALYPTDGPIKNRPETKEEKQRSNEAKRKAEKYKKRLQDKLEAEGGQNIAVRVRKLRCDDASPPGFYWTVWLNNPRVEDTVTYDGAEPRSDWGRSAARKYKQETELIEEGKLTEEERTAVKSTRKKRRGGQTKAGGSEDVATSSWNAAGVTKGYAEGVPVVQAARPAARVHERCPVCNAPAMEDLKPSDRKFWSKPMASSTGVGCRSGWVYPDDWKATIEVKDKKGNKKRVRNKPDGKPTNPHLPRVNAYIERVGMKQAVEESEKYRRNL